MTSFDIHGINLNDVFDNIYSNQHWYGGGSGEGSTIEFNKNDYIPYLRNYINIHDIKSVVDIGSGDGQCLHSIYHDKPIQYFGYDCSKTIITETKKKYEDNKFHFELIDGNAICLYIRKEVDLIIIKDVLQHWSTPRIVSFLKELVHKISFKKCLLINDITRSNTMDIEDGKWRCINWNSPCFDEFNYKTELIYGKELLKEVVEFHGIKA